MPAAAGSITPSQEILAGVIAGVVDACACHPVDQIKTQFHVNTAANGSMLKALASEAQKGGVARLYRGLPAAALRPQALCMYTGNEWCKARRATLCWSGTRLTRRAVSFACWRAALRLVRHRRSHAAHRHCRGLLDRLLGERRRDAL